MNLRYMNICQSLSALSDHPQHRHGACLIRKNRIIGRGYNKYKTHPASNHPFFNLHAELSAILDARKDVAGSTCYLYRQRKDGHIANSKPCPFCMELLKQYKIKDVYYTTETGIEYLILEG